MVAEKEQRLKKNNTKQIEVIPDYLICEVMDGQPLCYKGYKDVLSKKKKIEDVKYSSSLQGILVSYIFMLCVKQNINKRYEILTGKLGLYLNTNNNFICDIAIYDSALLTPDKINKHYADVPPKLVIEVDIMIEMDDHKDARYMRKKVDKLHAFGTEKVLWILTASRQVIIAPNGKPWQVHDWDNDIELLDDVIFNIGGYLKGKGIVVEE